MSPSLCACFVCLARYLTAIVEVLTSVPGHVSVVSKTLLVVKFNKPQRVYKAAVSLLNIL